MDNDPRVPVGMEIDKVLDKFTSFDDYSSSALENLQEKLQELQGQLEQGQLGKHDKMLPEASLESMTKRRRRYLNLKNIRQYETLSVAVAGLQPD